jgi:hypothetical protein
MRPLILVAARFWFATISIMVSDANVGARRLYERLGYREVARRTMVKEQWVSDGDEWVLLIKLFNFVCVCQLTFAVAMFVSGPNAKSEAATEMVRLDG